MNGPYHEFQSDNPVGGQADNVLGVFGCQGRRAFLHPGFECAVLLTICSQCRVQIMLRNRSRHALFVWTMRFVGPQYQRAGHKEVGPGVSRNDVFLVEVVIGHFYPRAVRVDTENHLAVYRVSHRGCFT